MPITYIGRARSDSPFLYDIIQQLGLTASLNFVLDAADTRSYDGSSQTWTDATGNGNNFFRGTTSGAEATDPTFNGTAGAPTEGTYFSFDGGDYFTETAAHTFADGWHKDNGAYSLVAVVYAIDSGSGRYFFGNTTVSLDGVGARFNPDETCTVVQSINNTSNQGIAIGTATAASWNFMGCSCDEATLAAVAQLNGSASSPGMSASTATDNNGSPLRIGAQGDATNPLVSGERLACIAGWSTPIGATALSDIYTRLKARRFTSLP